jgi:hypothetical protein
MKVPRKKASPILRKHPIMRRVRIVSVLCMAVESIYCNPRF